MQLGLELRRLSSFGFAMSGSVGGSGRKAAVEFRFHLREREVLSYVFEEFGNKEIAERIGVSASSALATLQQLFSKTGVRTRSQLVRIALEQHRDQL